MLNQLHIKANGCFIYLEVILDLINNQTITLRQIKDIPGTLSGKRNLFSRAQIRLSFFTFYLYKDYVDTISKSNLFEN